MSSYRKKWEQSSSGAPPQIASKALVPAQNVHTKAYDQYLAMLQERNRLLKKLREKDSHQVELEKREQGFALYLNGANLSHAQARPHPQAPPSRKSRHPTSDINHQQADQKRPSKTADSNHIVSSEGFDGDGLSRAKTAPSKRKSWIHDSVELRTEDGDPIHVKAPGIFSGKYEDDFESTLTPENTISTSGPMEGDTAADSANLAQDHDNSNDTDRPGDKTACSEGAQSDFDESAGSGGEGEEEEDDTLTVSFQDISALRRSLEQDKMIRESLANERNNTTSNDDHDGDSLNSSTSSEESCAEEIEDENSSHPCSTTVSPPMAGATDVTPPGFTGSDGIVLQFAKIKSTHPSRTRSQEFVAKNDSLIQLSPSSTVSLSSATGVSEEKLSENLLKHKGRKNVEEGVEWMESQPSQASLANRSLSAVKRKERHKKSVGDREICDNDMDEVLEALKNENESLTSLRVNMGNKFPIAGDKVGGMKEVSKTFDTFLKNSSSTATTEDEKRESKDSVDCAPPRIKDALLPSLPFRPVLVNRYKQAAVTAKTLARSRDTGATIAMPLAREEEEHATNTALQQRRQPQASSEAGGDSREEQHEARESLTEKTVKIITDKVRQMDARKQRRLLRLLTRLDRQVSPPLVLPPPKTPSSSQDAQKMTTSSSTRGTVAMVTTSGPNSSHSPPPSWLRSKSIDSQNILNSRAMFDNIHNIHRTMSTQSSGTRSRLSKQQNDEYAEISRSQPNLMEDSRSRIADIIGESFMYSGTSKSQPSSRPNSRPVSGRKSGIRGEISSVASGLCSRPDLSTIRGDISSAASGLESRPDMSTIRGGISSSAAISRLASGRMSGIRGELYSRQKSRLDSRSPLSSASDPHLPTFLDAKTDDDGKPLMDRDEPPQRLQTAVLAKGRRTLRLNASGSDTCLVPCIGDDDDSDDVVAMPTLSRAEPGLSSTHFDVDYPHPPRHSERQSLNECLESISKFDHVHLGQMGSNIQDDVLESFLSEYREKRKHRQQKSAKEAVGVVGGGGDDPFDSIDYSITSSISTTTTDPVNTDWIPTSTDQQRDDRTSRDMEDSFDNDDEEEQGGGEEYYFTTPEHPTGVELVLNLLSTWGDKFYIGLTGIEVYTSTGIPANIAQISADPADINILPEYSSDPRVVSNLLDGVNQTRDDLHMWLAPFTPGHTHIVRIMFAKPTTLAMVRIWNYNKSRIHSWRGARLVEMYLDGRLIFQGEIARASGGVRGAEGSETILFTTDAEVLSMVADHDPLYQEEVGAVRETESDASTQQGGGGWEGERQIEIERPQTADRDDPSDHSDTDVMQQYSDQRPFTTARTSLQQHEEKSELIQSNFTHGGDDTLHPSPKTEQDEVIPYSPNFELKSSRSNRAITGRVVELYLTESWGDPGYIGLTSVELLQTDNREPLSLRDDQLSDGTEGERRRGGEHNLATLVDGVNVTTDTDHMYLCPTIATSASAGSSTMMSSGHVIIMLDTPTQLYGLRIWNYNASLEDSYKGVKVLHVYVDGECVSPQSGYLIRRAPGHTHYDYGQTLVLQLSHGGGEELTDHHTTAESANSQTVPPLPKGCIQ